MDESTAKKQDSLLRHAPAVASDLNLPLAGVTAVVRLLAEGATVPFIARYRKEATGDLDEVAIRSIEERATYVAGMEDRRASVLDEIKKQGKLTPELEKKLKAATTKAEIEDLYLPFKPKRRTRAIIAKERGLEPLADLLWAQGEEDPTGAAAAFVDAAKEVPDVAAALAGARDIAAERIAESAEARGLVRRAFEQEGVMRVGKTKEHEDKPTKFDAYASFDEPVRSIPSHRYLAIRRGETEGVLRASLDVEADKLLPQLLAGTGRRAGSPWAGELEKAAQDALSRLLLPSVQVDVRVELKMRADKEAVSVFASNLRELLLAAPYGGHRVLGIDPGQRTGCKCAVLSETGKLLEHTTIYLVQGAEAERKARAVLAELVKKHNISAVAVGNGTHGRETESFAREVVGSDAIVVSVSEAGASVYSASDVAREELPDVDLTVRGAVSIARRLQDPLAELVKIDPKSIGVGQYQHDVFPALLAKELDGVVESCVNLVGVELNTASAPLLSRVSGIGPTLAKRIVDHRDNTGPFKSRAALKDVAGVGPKTFEQCAGFLRIRGAENPLDASAVHPERYGTVERIARDLGVPVHQLVGDADRVKQIPVAKYVEEGDGKLDRLGEATLRDILAELVKPGRDPRKTFEPPKFRDDVRTMEDLKPGMTLEGVVTNVTAFGAFVDVGVHQDGLVHVSQLADRFVKNPSDVVKVGDKITVRVMEVDLVRKRIGLTAKSGAVVPSGGPAQRSEPGPKRRPPARTPEPRVELSKGELKHNPFAALRKG
ncbi:MAG: RNA-binding transcriptional accessory protein [Myxococcales bacterium]|nr:RNA-binding transcriptional accessory protein [Myxococcales bacterium]